MSEAPILLYLEADDEITAVVRRVRGADPGRVVIVAPGRSRATSSAVALRLLAREDREIAIVGDALTRSLAAEAGLASYASVEDARRAAPGEATAPEPRHATIHVVRGRESDTVAPMAAVSAPPAAPEPAPSAGPPAWSEAETRPVPVVREVKPRPPSRRAAPAPRRPGRLARPARRTAAPAVLGILAALLVTGVVAGAVLLPAATIEIVPVTAEIGPRTYEIAVDGERRTGTVEAEATVTATGTYADQAAASGSVVLYNWTFFPVRVPAGTFVAAGEQAFATQSDVMVPRGRLTGAGTILAGDVEVAVVAAAVGPAANVAAGAIDTVVNESIDLRLGGVPENPERRVDNPAPTSGGIDESGPEITEEDVTTAVEGLRAELERRAAAALPADEGGIVLREEGAQPAIEGADELAGTRDQAEAAISGTLEWAVRVADPEEVTAAAADELAGDPSAVPEGHGLLPDATDVTLGEARADGERIVVEATVTGRSTAVLDEATVRNLVRGRSADEARAALSGLGTATVELWPPWVGSVPGLSWRIDVRIDEGPAATASPEASMAQ